MTKTPEAREIEQNLLEIHHALITASDEYQNNKTIATYRWLTQLEKRVRETKVCLLQEIGCQIPSLNQERKT